MKNQVFGLRALLMSSVVATPVAAAEWEISLGGYMEQHLGYASVDTAAGTDFDGGDINSDREFYFRPEITLDNGLTFSARMDFEGTGEEEGVDEPQIAISGSFGTILIGEDDLSSSDTIISAPNAAYLGANSGTLTGFVNYDACSPGRRLDRGLGGDQESGRITYFTPRFAGFNIGVSYAQDVGGRSRGSMATEQFGNVLNPAFEFDYGLSGIRYGLQAGYCIDTDRVLPTYVSLGLGGSLLNGSDAVSNLNFPNGLGATSMGGVPGVFIASPTDILGGSFNVDRDSLGINLNVVQPIRFNIATQNYEELVATPSGSFWRPLRQGPSFGVVSLIGGVKYGMVEQTETVRINADTPAFGANSAWNADYRTKFDSDVYGAHIGLSSSRTYAGRNGATNTFGIAGTVGYDFHKITVHDSVDATGLGGALNFTNSQRHSFDEGVVTASLSTSYIWKKDNSQVSLSLGLEYGSTPKYDYSRPDSTVLGPLNPTLDVKPDTSFVIGAGFSLSF